MHTIQLGWSPDVPDFRDRFIQKSRVASLPSCIDLREPNLDIELTGAAANHASCATMMIGLLDWQSRKWTGTRKVGSVDFLHALTIKLFGGGGATGSSIRNTIKTLKRFGVPPVNLWRFDEPASELLANPTLYGFFRRYEGIEYIRLDPWSHQPPKKIGTMKSWIAGGNPFMIGYSVPHFIDPETKAIPFDIARGATLGGSTGIVMGFDDRYTSYCQFSDLKGGGTVQGAFLLRTCVGSMSRHEDFGYVWLPYKFVESQFARDAWAVIPQSIA